MTEERLIQLIEQLSKLRKRAMLVAKILAKSPKYKSIKSEYIEIYDIELDFETHQFCIREEIFHCGEYEGIEEMFIPNELLFDDELLEKAEKQIEEEKRRREEERKRRLEQNRRAAEQRRYQQYLKLKQEFEEYQNAN